MAQGVVKWFNSEKGYGYISPEGGGQDLFVHFSAIEKDWKTLDEGEKVEYEITNGTKGPQAVQVKSI